MNSRVTALFLPPHLEKVLRVLQHPVDEVKGEKYERKDGEASKVEQLDLSLELLRLLVGPVAV
jgi:hypothetical protein